MSQTLLVLRNFQRTSSYTVHFCPVHFSLSSPVHPNPNPESPQCKEVEKMLVDTPFWSWDTGLSGTYWPKWPRESPQKVTFSEGNIFWWDSGVDSHWLWRPDVVPCKSFTKQFLFLVYLVVIQSHQTINFGQPLPIFFTPPPGVENLSTLLRSEEE